MNDLFEYIRESIFKCTECGIEVDSFKWANGSELEQKQLCMNCEFWMGYVEEANNPSSVRVNGHHYWIEKEDDKGMRGYDGKPFLIKFKDGREVRTTNLWNQGQIPKLFKDRLVDNAIFGKIQRNKYDT